jgi:hypothetical protein
MQLNTGEYPAACGGDALFSSVLRVFWGATEAMTELLAKVYKSHAWMLEAGV